MNGLYWTNKSHTKCSTNGLSDETEEQPLRYKQWWEIDVIVFCTEFYTVIYIYISQ